jgi:hypothetical protein
MKVITTVHKAGFEQYGHRWIDSIKNWPGYSNFAIYAEGFDLPETGQLKVTRIESLGKLAEFKAKYANYRPVSWQWDVVRFANKVYAAYDALYAQTGIAVWLDADCVTHQPIPEGYIESLLPEAHYMSLLKRVGYHTETGFWVMNCDHPEHKAFLDTWLAWFETGKFKELREWHDCTTLDATVKLFERDGRLKTHNLSGEFARDMHPISKIDLGRYIDHCKGNRKAQGVSPENEFRKAA